MTVDHNRLVGKPVVDEEHGCAKLALYEAKTHLAALLDAVANGETVVITRRGRPIARIVPAASADRSKIADLISRMKAARDTRARMTRDEILEARDFRPPPMTFVLDASTPRPGVCPMKTIPRLTVPSIA